jgi:hypothetical protein
MGQSDSALKNADLSSDTLRLTDAGINADRAKRISKHLEGNTRVKNLYMSWNGLEDAGCLVLSSLLRKNQCLRLLDLSSNGIHNPGARHLAKAISGNSLLVLKELHLQNNFITDEGARALVEAITPNQTISLLDLYENPITDSMRELVRQLSYRDAIKMEDDGMVVMAAPDLSRSLPQMPIPSEAKGPTGNFNLGKVEIIINTNYFEGPKTVAGSKSAIDVMAVPGSPQECDELLLLCEQRKEVRLFTLRK